MHVASQKVRLAQYHVVGLLAPNIYFKHVMTQVQIRELEHVRNLGIEFEPTGITKYQVLQLDVYSIHIVTITPTNMPSAELAK